MPRYSEAEVRRAVEQSICLSGALRVLGLRTAGGNHRTLRRLIERYDISTDHFDPDAARRAAGRARRPGTPLEEVLVAGSSYNRGRLKQRLLEAGLKCANCELCGQGEMWRGRRMSLILDHINGRADDNRLENLRIVCPNCASTLDTHCGRNLPPPAPRECVRCKATFRPRDPRQRYCSSFCGSRHRNRPKTNFAARKVQRPGPAELTIEVEQLGFAGAARLYGVSRTSIRKWLRQYERYGEPDAEPPSASTIPP